MHIVIVDILGIKPTRIISLYRSFRPLDRTPGAFFEAQLEILKNAQCSGCYILGDFNLDARMDSRPDYDRKIPLAQLSDFAVQNNFLQIVDFDTWSRVINGIKKESLIDHIYDNDISSVLNLKSEVPTFGDHLLLILELNLTMSIENKCRTIRNWKSYTVFSTNDVSTMLNSVTSCYKTIMFGRVTYARRPLRRELFSVYLIHIL